MPVRSSESILESFVRLTEFLNDRSVNSDQLPQEEHASDILESPYGAQIPTIPLDFSEAGLRLYSKGISKISTTFLKSYYDALRTFKEAGSLTEGFLAAASKIPAEFYDLAKRLSDMQVPESRNPKPQSISAPGAVRVGVIAFEPCNRKCSFCGASSSPDSERFSFSNLKQWLKGRTAGQIVATFGEPFIYHSSVDGRLVTIAHVAEYILSQDCSSTFSIHTSGINFGSKLEAMAAEKLAIFSPEIKERITIRLTVSSFPKFGSRMPEEVQIDTAAFAMENGFYLEIVNFDKNREVKKAIVEPAITRLLGSPISDGSLFYPGTIFERQPEPFGSAIQNRLMGSEDARNFMHKKIGCTMQEGVVMLSSEGKLCPPCCHWMAPFIVLGSATEKDTEIREKTRIWKQEVQKRAREESSCDVCEHCMKMALERNAIRKPEQFRKVVPYIFKKT